MLVNKVMSLIQWGQKKSWTKDDMTDGRRMLMRRALPLGSSWEEVRMIDSKHASWR